MALTSCCCDEGAATEVSGSNQKVNSPETLGLGSDSPSILPSPTSPARSTSRVTELTSALLDYITRVSLSLWHSRCRKVVHPSSRRDTT